MMAAREIWLWQNIVSPHMAGLVVGLAKLGCQVTYLAAQAMSDDRTQQGWSLPALDGVRLVLVTSPEQVSGLVASAPPESIHICSGIRSNGLIGVAQKMLKSLGLRQWVIMETVADAGWRGGLKRHVYKWLFARWRNYLQGVLAIGHSTSAWIAAREVPAEKIFPFAYFLPAVDHTAQMLPEKNGHFRFLFVGQFIELKRLDLLVETLASLLPANFELAVVGSGPLEQALRNKALNTLPGRVEWIGRLALEAIPQEMAKADCLVLPSRHDGWGAVVSEALMVGTPAICSEACGSAGVVRASGYGGVFRSGDRDVLTLLLTKNMAKGRLSLAERSSLVEWAECLGGSAGAAYLMRILDHADGRTERPLPPWQATVPSLGGGA